VTSLAAVETGPERAFVGAIGLEAAG
jgi:hypothetical protein